MISVFLVPTKCSMDMQRGVRERDGVMGTELNAASAPAVRLGGLIDLRRKLRATFIAQKQAVLPQFSQGNK